MADKLKASTVKNSFTACLAEVSRRIKEVTAQKEKAKEYNGLAAQKTKDATETHNINKWAFTAVTQLKKKEPTEQIDRVVTFLALALHEGALNQIDLFDDRLTYCREKMAELMDADAPKPPAPGSENIAKLAAVN